MAQKKALTDEELFAQFEDIPSASAEAATPPTKTPRAHKPGKPSVDTPAVEDDPLAELSALAAARPASRPSTPRLSSSTTSGTNRRETPGSSGPPSGRTSEDKLRTTGGTAPRKSTESARSYHTGQRVSIEDASDTGAGSISAQRAYNTPRTSSPELREKSPAAGGDAGGGGGGGWWGSMMGAASAAVKQAEAAVKEIRGNEEAIRWAEQVRGNVEKVKEYGMNFASSAEVIHVADSVQGAMCVLWLFLHLPIFYKRLRLPYLHTSGCRYTPRMTSSHIPVWTP